MRDLLVYWFILICYLFVNIKYSTMILQQNHYHKDRYLHWLKSNWLQKRTIGITLLLCCMYVCFFLRGDYRKEVILLMMALTAYFAYKIDREIKYRLPLKYTHRIKRLLCARCIFYVVFAWLFTHGSDSVWMLCTPWIYWLPFFEILISLICVEPIERMIQQYYVNDAKTKLAKRNDLKIIGITGSYGKTSVKNILYTLLNEQYDTLMTPKSFNNKMGITLTIRNSLKRMHQIFLCEMGADHVGEILELMRFVKPQIGIVTAIGPQHLATFHSMEHIVREKMYMIEELPANGIGFLNADNTYIRSHPLASDCKIIWFGKDIIADYRILDIQPYAKGTQFLLQYKKEQYSFDIKLLGEHNVYNTCCGIAVAHEMGIPFTKLQQLTKEIPYVKHRLQIVSNTPYTIIDDAYNANPTGAHNALMVLQAMKERTIIVTPGMIELGEKEDIANYTFGKEMAECVDEVILVGVKVTSMIQKGLMEEGFDENHLHICKDFASAMHVLKEIVQEHDVVLLENDLPDAFSH